MINLMLSITVINQDLKLANYFPRIFGIPATIRVYEITFPRRSPLENGWYGKSLN